MTDLPGLEAWLPDNDTKPFFGLDRTVECRFDRPSWKNYIQPLMDNIREWKQAQLEPDMYYAPSTRPWRNVRLRILRRQVAARAHRWSHAN